MILSDQVEVMPQSARKVLEQHFGKPVEWSALQSGATRHLLFQAQVDDRYWVARIDPGTPRAPGVDPVREQQVLATIQEQVWAIQPKLYLPESGVMLMQSAGRVIERDGLTPAQIEQICQSVDQMHSISAVPLLDYASLFAAYRRVFSEGQPGLVQLIDETEWLLADLPDIGECLVHHDLHTGNLLWGHGLTLIDWEYAGRGNPWLDYATLERDIGLSLQQLQQFKRLSGFTAVQLEHELARAIQVVDQLENIWRHFIQPPTEE